MLAMTKFNRYNTRMIKKRQALILSCHPDSRSFCRSLAQTAFARLTKISEEMGDAPTLEVKSIELYDSPIDPILSYEELFRKTSFDPILQEYVSLIQSLDILVLVYPDWWGQMPGLLKGWIDRVFRPGLAYTFVGPDEGPKEPKGLLSHLKTFVYITTDQEASLSGESSPSPKGKLLKPKEPLTSGVTHTPHHAIWHHLAGFTDLNLVDLKVFGPMYRATLGQRKRWIEEMEKSLTSLVPTHLGSP